MTEYEVRRTHRENLQTDRLRAVMSEVFGGVEEREGKLVASYGALKELTIWPVGKDRVGVHTEMNPDVSNEAAHKTIKAYNDFLERITGYTSKERGKRIQKAAKKGEL